MVWLKYALSEQSTIISVTPYLDLNKMFGKKGKLRPKYYKFRGLYNNLIYTSSAVSLPALSSSSKGEEDLH